jgi:hypothetical protein
MTWWDDEPARSGPYGFRTEPEPGVKLPQPAHQFVRQTISDSCGVPWCHGYLDDLCHTDSPFHQEDT